MLLPPTGLKSYGIGWRGNSLTGGAGRPSRLRMQRGQVTSVRSLAPSRATSERPGGEGRRIPRSSGSTATCAGAVPGTPSPSSIPETRSTPRHSPRTAVPTALRSSRCGYWKSKTLAVRTQALGAWHARRQHAELSLRQCTLGNALHELSLNPNSATRRSSLPARNPRCRVLRQNHIVRDACRPSTIRIFRKRCSDAGIASGGFLNVSPSYIDWSNAMAHAAGPALADRRLYWSRPEGGAGTCRQRERPVGFRIHWDMSPRSCFR